MKSAHWVPLLFFLLVCPPVTAGDRQTPPDLMLAEGYHQDIAVRDYLVSEKLDGVRARWDGTHLISRGGLVFAAPDWFTGRFPAVPLDGELWMGRGRYEETSSVVRRTTPHDGWRNIRFMVFDLPGHGGTFEQRVAAMRRIIDQTKSPYLAMIAQETLDSREALQARLGTVVEQGGEGLMLHRKTARYASGRSQDLLKLKLFMDAEATVIGYRPGKGRLAGLMGSLKVRTDEGVVFHIGSGLSDNERRHPPPLNSRITFRYQGLTKNGIPRFPVFLRIRDEEPE